MMKRSSSDPAVDVAEKLLASGGAIEARAWLATTDGVTRSLGELSTPAAASRLVQELYRAGAVEVLAVEIARSVRETLYEDEVRESTGHLVVRLPDEQAKRRRVFSLQGREARRIGYDPTADVGQRLLYVKLD